jgi:hypothetical protein
MDYWSYASAYYTKPACQYYLIEDEANGYANEFLPTYNEHHSSPRCVEDIQNPAPSYFSILYPPIQSGADRLADWLVSRTYRAFGRR